ncbi:g9379 [Coccomyxa viridis]|uniref:DNA polymerase n=1 Tax=Coccomyxa viridis TaxID=1274662 RepID=A0ABP1G5H0_9CHLO
MQFRPAASYFPGKDLVCQVTDWHAEDTDDADTEDVPEVKTRYIVTAYAVTKEGWSVSIKVTGFCPFFFVELPEAFESKSLNSLLGAARGLVKPTSAAAIKHTKIVQRRKLAPFDNGKMHRFLEISFLNKNAFYDYARAFGGGSIGVTGAGVVKLEPCESNIDPLLRMIHCRDLQPAGWVRIPKNKHYRPDHDRSTCQISCQTDYRFLRPHEQPTIAPILMASFDIEADSSHGDFPLAKKDHRKLALDLIEYFDKRPAKDAAPLADVIASAFLGNSDHGMQRIDAKRMPTDVLVEAACRNIENNSILTDIGRLKKIKAAKSKATNTGLLRSGETPNDAMERMICNLVRALQGLPAPQGDKVIQIGTTFTRYADPDYSIRHVITLDTCDPIEGVIVHSCKTERDVLLAWKDLIVESDPDVIVGYNTFGFDVKFMSDRADELGIGDVFRTMSRQKGLKSKLEEKKLSSSALGDNLFYIIPMRGRVQIDLMKAIQGDASVKLDSYSLDNVSSTYMRGPIRSSSVCEGRTTIETKSTAGLLSGSFIKIVKDTGIIEIPFADGRKFNVTSVTPTSMTLDADVTLDTEGSFSWSENKDDISVQDIFSCQAGSSADRARVAKYCVKDCELVGRLMERRDILSTRIAQANVCCVPLSYMFLRGQGVRVFSLVAKQCRQDGYIVPVIRPKASMEDDEEREGYEGAIVLEPVCDIHYEPVAVADFNSLYPSSIISVNLSHETLVTDPTHDNLPGLEYETINYDNYEYRRLGKGDAVTKVLNEKEPVKTCRFVQPKKSADGTIDEASRGVLPRILIKLLAARKAAKKRMAQESDPAKKKLLDGLQSALKITANSVYGQCGSSTSPVCCKQVAASTTATGRKCLLFARDFVLENYPNSRCVYGDTDSIFMSFHCADKDGQRLRGLDAIQDSHQLCEKAAGEISRLLKWPHNLEPEKVAFLPQILHDN